MEKSVLVIETPETCGACRFRTQIYGLKHFCHAMTPKDLIQMNTKREDCPLQKLSEIMQSQGESTIESHTSTAKAVKYDNMIQAFASDFELAEADEESLSALESKIKNKDERLLHDIEQLSELAYLLRSGKAEIHLVEAVKED